MPLDVLASAGQRRWVGYVEVEPGVSLPCAILRGAKPGKRLLVTAGVHGAEYSSIEGARRLTELSPDAIAGELTILPIVSIEAFWKHLPFVNPLDGKNLNRTFPGKADGTISERRAAWLNAAIAGMDGLVDLHCGDITEALIPFAVFPAGNEASQALAAASGFPYAVGSTGVGHSYSAAAAAGVPGLILESGGNGLWTEATVTLITDGVRRIMARLGMCADTGAPAPATRVGRMVVTKAPDAGFWHPAIKPGDTIARGDRAGTVSDLVGQWRHDVTSPESGPVLYISTSLAASKDEALFGVGVF